MDSEQQEDKIEYLIRQIKEFEKELEEELQKSEERLKYTYEHGKIIFREEIIEEGRSTIISSLRYLSSFPFLAVLTIPIIWSMMIPALISDILVTIYQYTCFPIYRIPLVKRSDYIVMDRYNLFYLDRVEKFNCWYCEYFNGVVAYVREVAARTEQFWCPIKHAKDIRDKHSRYDRFFSYGDYKSYREQLQKRRSEFDDISSQKDD